LKSTVTVLFVLAMLISTTQTFRHVYVKWVEPHGSVLDQFKDGVESDIARAKSLEELVELYADAQKAVTAYEADTTNPKIRINERQHTEPYKSEQKIRNEIEAREYDANQLFKLWFYWVCGLFSLGLGVLTFFKVNRWLGVSGMIIAFTEMLCWTSPLFHTRLLSQQFEYLLNYKLVFSFVTWGLIIILWLFIEKYDVLAQRKLQD